MNMCPYDVNGRCRFVYSIRWNCSCNPKCELYKDVQPPKNPSKDPPRWVARITSKAVALISHRKEKHHGKRNS